MKIEELVERIAGDISALESKTDLISIDYYYEKWGIEDTFRLPALYGFVR